MMMSQVSVPLRRPAGVPAAHCWRAPCGLQAPLPRLFVNYDHISRHDCVQCNTYLNSAAGTTSPEGRGAPGRRSEGGRGSAKAQGVQPSRPQSRGPNYKVEGLGRAGQVCGATACLGQESRPHNPAPSCSPRLAPGSLVKPHNAVLFLLRLQRGDVVQGVVNNVTDYGAFVMVNGIQMLLHKTQMSFRQDFEVDKVIQAGDEVKVRGV